METVVGVEGNDEANARLRKEALNQLRRRRLLARLCISSFGVYMWTALMPFLLGIFNACDIIIRFTRIAGELFGMLIVVLFIQEAIKGVMNECRVPKGEDPKAEKYQFQWLYVNGLLSIIFAFGLLYTALKSRKAQSWLYGTGLGF